MSLGSTIDTLWPVLGARCLISLHEVTFFSIGKLDQYTVQGLGVGGRGSMGIPIGKLDQYTVHGLGLGGRGSMGSWENRACSWENLYSSQYAREPV